MRHLRTDADHLILVHPLHPVRSCYFERELTGWSSKPWPPEIKYIPFWSDFVERFA